jgi:hypothetical protein
MDFSLFTEKNFSPPGQKFPEARFPGRFQDFPDRFTLGLGLVEESLVPFREAEYFFPLFLLHPVPGELPLELQFFLQLLGFVPVFFLDRHTQFSLLSLLRGKLCAKWHQNCLWKGLIPIED